MRLASLFFVALAAGGAFVVFHLYNPDRMGDASWVSVLQLGMRNLIPLAVALNLGLLFTLIATVLARRERPAFGLLAGASVCVAIGLLATIIGNWPLNNQIGTWTVAAPPTDWSAISHRWWRYHQVRTAGLVIGLLLLIVAALKSTRPEAKTSG